jgi:hypothetical protein
MPSIDKHFIEQVVSKVEKNLSEFNTFIETDTYRGDDRLIIYLEK